MNQKLKDSEFLIFNSVVVIHLNYVKSRSRSNNPHMNALINNEVHFKDKALIK